jgi:hypothetical protein
MITTYIHLMAANFDESASNLTELAGDCETLSTEMGGNDDPSPCLDSALHGLGAQA